MTLGWANNASQLFFGATASSCSCCSCSVAFTVIIQISVVVSLLRFNHFRTFVCETLVIFIKILAIFFEILGILLLIGFFTFLFKISILFITILLIRTIRKFRTMIRTTVSDNCNRRNA